MLIERMKACDVQFLIMNLDQDMIDNPEDSQELVKVFCAELRAGGWTIEESTALLLKTYALH